MKRLSTLFKINPIVVKEIRSRMRGPRAFITLTLILVVMGGLMYGMLQLILASARYTNVLSPQVGQTLFAALAFLELFMICAVTPAVTAGAISGEKEKQTYEMLMATPLSATSVLSGKLISALSYVLLLLFAGIPLASVVFIFGGVAPREMLKALMVLIVIAIAFGILGLFLSALFGRTGRATVAAFILVIALMIGPIFMAGLVGVLRGSEPPRWLLTPSPISALSSALAPSMGTDMGGSIFYLLSGLFSMGVSPMSQTSIPRPLYHYTIPFYTVLSLLLYMISTRLVQPARRWRMRRRDVLIGAGTLLLVAAIITGAYFLTASRYEWAGSPQTDLPNGGVMVNPAFPAPAVAQERVVVVPEMPTPTPVNPEGAVASVVLAEDTQAEIYAAVARQLYTVDHTFGNQPPNWPKLLLIANTDDGVGDPNITKLPSVQLPEAVTAGVAERLSDLPAGITWINSQKEANMDPKSGQVENGEGAMITFGNIHMQENGTAHVSASLYFSSLGATGKTYILTQEDGVWKVTGSTGVEWIS